jgi:hypothetical protein
MSDQDEREEQQIAEARARDERAAQLLGDYSPMSQPLHMADVRANLWHDIINYLDRIAESGPEELASKARELLDRVHTL